MYLFIYLLPLWTLLPLFLLRHKLRPYLWPIGASQFDSWVVLAKHDVNCSYIFSAVTVRKCVCMFVFNIKYTIGSYFRTAGLNSELQHFHLISSGFYQYLFSPPPRILVVSSAWNLLCLTVQIQVFLTLFCLNHSCFYGPWNIL